MKTIAEQFAFQEFSGSPPPLELIPPDSIVLLTGLRSVFGPQLASYWRSKGLDVVMITIEQGARSGVLPDGTVVLAAHDYEPKSIKLLKHGPFSFLAQVERSFYERRPATQRIVAPYSYYSAIRYAAFGLGVVHLVHRISPRVVFAQCMMRYAFAAAVLSRSFPVVGMPYGQDIFRHAYTSYPHKAMTNWALNSVDFLCPASESAVQHMVRDFHVDPGKIRAISWGVDRNLFYRPSSTEKQLLRLKYGVPPNALVVMNIRRFARGWGSRTVSLVFHELAERHKDLAFVLIGGAGQESLDEFRRMQSEIGQAGMWERFFAFESGVTLETFAELARLSDIYVSLMLGSDMRSASILQGAASGAAPILTDWIEYREMEKHGFRAQFVPMNDKNATVEAIEYLRNDSTFMNQIVAANLDYIAEYENYEVQMNTLLEVISQATKSHRFGRNSRTGPCEQ